MKESLKVIQKCQVSDYGFSKPWFIKLVTENMSQEEFNRFCREVMLLNFHYDSTIGLHCTDVPDKVLELNPSVLFQLEEVDFDSPITFRAKPPKE